MKTELENTIINLWHLSKTALCKQEYCERWDRMLYIKKELYRTYPKLIEGMTNKQIWFKITDMINPTTTRCFN